MQDSWRSWGEADKQKLLRELRRIDSVRTYHRPGLLAPVIDPSSAIQTPALDILDRALIDAEQGAQPWLIFSMPPQEGKSQRVSRIFPTWCLLRDPSRRIAIASYADDIAMRWGRQIRDDITANPNLGLALHPSIGAAREWQLDGHRGGVVTTGMAGALTGRPVDVMIIDDPLKDREEAESPTMRERCINFWRSKASTRLPEKSVVVLIMCMTGDTPVLMADGTERPLAKVRPGDAVATYEDGRLSTSTVRNWMSQGIDTVYEIRMKSGARVRANARHPFLTVDADGNKSWVKTRNLQPGEFILRATGESGEESSAQPTGATFPFPARACARPTTTKPDGPMGSAPHRSTRSPAESPDSSTGTGSSQQTLRTWKRLKEGFARFAASLRRNAIPGHIGMASFASTTTMTRASSADCSATTATLPSGTGRHRRSSVPQLSTWSATPDEILEINPAGEAEVFDIQVDRTENFIAGGLVSHNTRWHENDLAGYLIDEHKQDFRLINIPAQAEHSGDAQDCKCAGDGGCLGREVLGRQPGEYMVSTRDRSIAGWEKKKRAAGSYDWAALYQGHPSPAEGGELKRHWWRRFPHHMRAVQRSDGTMHALGAKTVIMTIDAAFKDQDSSDFVCLQIWAAQGSRAWLLDQVCERLSFTDTCAALIALAAKWPQARRKIIEDKANGPAVVSAMRGKVGGLIEYTPTDSKLARVRSIAPFVEAGDVEIPEDAPFTSAFVEQCAAFPNGANDDMVDCCSLALIKLLLEGLGNEFFDELMKEQAGRGSSFQEEGQAMAVKVLQAFQPTTQRPQFGSGWTPQSGR